MGREAVTQDKDSYPGTPRHQAALRAIVDHYRADLRVLAVVVFGSLGRGNWHACSDIDLDVVIADGVSVDVTGEVHGLCRALAKAGEGLFVVAPDGDEAADVVFESLLQLSVRYHPLGTTKPCIVDSMLLLTGRIDRETVVAAGLANAVPAGDPLTSWLNECVRYAAVAHAAWRRKRIWLAVELLHRMRSNLKELYVFTHGGGRIWEAFGAAPPRIQGQLSEALPQAQLESVRHALLHLVEILASDLEEWSNGQLVLSEAQARVLTAVRVGLLDDEGGPC